MRLKRLNAAIPADDRIAPEQMAAPIASLYANWGKPDSAAKWRNAPR